MSYHTFNNWVYKYYEENLIPNQINTLTIPKSILEDFLLERNIVITSFLEIKEFNWSYLLKENSTGIPKYLGLIALQCHAAFMMHNDGTFAADNFRDRFIELLDIESQTKLNSLFSEIYSESINVQEKLWELVSRFYNSRNVLVNIPQKKSYTGRNTQFPLSQSILNYEDLKEYKSFYLFIYNKYEVIHFNEFKTEFEANNLKFIYYFNRFNNKRQLSRFENDIKLKQVFDFFISHAWMPINEKKSLLKNELHQNLILKLNENTFTTYDQDFKIITNIEYLFKSKNTLVFQQDDIYKDEFNQCQKLILGSYYVLIVKNSIDTKLLITQLTNHALCKQLFKNSNETTSFLLNLQTSIPSFLIVFQGLEYPIKLIGNKISRKKQYFNIFPPKILSTDDTNYSLYCNGKRVDIGQPSDIGIYFIKVNGYSNYHFELIEIPEIIVPIPKLSSMLNFETLERTSIDGNGISGFSINYKEYDIRDSLSIRNWIVCNNGKKTNSSNIILKSINQNKYGKNK